MRPNTAKPAPGTVICRLDDLAEPGAKGFWYTSPSDRFMGFLVRKDGQVYGYEDQCPHAGWRLSPFDEEGYLTRGGDHIMCWGHMAVFRLQDGVCEAGPCVGQALTSWPVELEGDEVVAA